MATMTKAEEAVALYNQALTVHRRCYPSLHQNMDSPEIRRCASRRGLARALPFRIDLCGQVCIADVMIIGLRYSNTQAEDTAAREKVFKVVVVHQGIPKAQWRG